MPGEDFYSAKQISSLSQFLSHTPVSQPPQPSHYSEALLNLLNIEKITKRRQYFLKQNINLDGFRFEECRFDECVFYTDSGDVHLQDCVLGNGNSIIFGPRMAKVVKLASILDPQNINPALLAQLRQVGNTVTVSII